MDTRIPPDGPRRPASSTSLASSYDAPTGQLQPAGVPMVDRVQDAPPSSPTQLAVSSSSGLAPPQVTTALPHANTLVHPPVAPAEQAALALLTSLTGEDLVEHINASAQLIAQSALEVATWHGATAEVSQDLFMATRTGLIVGLLHRLEELVSPAAPQTAVVELKEVQEALADVGAWYNKLGHKQAQSIRVSREDDYTCAISRKSFAEIEHPVAVFSGNVAHVFEAEDLLQWIATSMQTPSNQGVATNPVDRTPLHLEQLTRAVNVLYAPVGPARG